MPTKKKTAKKKKTARKTTSRQAKTAKKKESTKEVNITPTSILVFLIIVLLAVYSIKYIQGNPAVQTTTTTVTAAPPAAPPAAQTEFVELGDIISVDYVGRFKKNNSVFDTSIPSVAQSEGLYDENRLYEPLKLVVGVGDVIPGFESAVMGMKIGDEKTVEIPPKEGYGEYDPTKIVFVNRTQEVPKVIPINYDTFTEAFETEPVVGDSYETIDSLWPLKVVNISAGVVYAEQIASAGITFDGMFGEAVIVGSTDDSFLVREDPTLGEYVYSMYGPVKVLDYNETEIVVDVNHPLAGETLEFTITLLDMMKG